MTPTQAAINSLQDWEREHTRLPLSADDIAILESVGGIVDLETGEYQPLPPDEPQPQYIGGGWRTIDRMRRALRAILAVIDYTDIDLYIADIAKWGVGDTENFPDPTHAGLPATTTRP